MKKGSDEALLAGGLYGLMQKQSIEREENNAIALALKAVENQELKDKQNIKGKKR
jgi:fructose-1-phosphate kinase PfkB-like protein